MHLIFKRQSTFPNDSLPQMCQKGYFVLLCQEIGQCFVNFVLWLLSIFKLLRLLARGMPEEKGRWRAVAREISGQKYVGLLHLADSHFPTLKTKT